MNQNRKMIHLRDFTDDGHPFGNIEGKEVFRKLVAMVEAEPHREIFGVSLSGIEATDASFPRESVIAVAKQFRQQKGFFLTDLTDRDLIDNWNYAAQAKEQPLVIWTADQFEIIGPELNAAARQLLEYVLTHRSVLASQTAADLGLSVQNASTRLKNLVSQGYVLRVEDVADTGGIEFKYQAIK
jgi:hypothetical protein